MKWLTQLLNPAASSSILEQAKDQLVVRTLNHLAHARTPVMLSFDNDKTNYLSTVLSVDCKTKTLKLDEVNSPIGHRKLLSGESFLITSHDGGIPLSFNAYVESSSTRNGLAYYSIALPIDFNYQQRRRAFRVELPTDYQLQMLLPGHPIIKGRLLNLSQNGLGVLFSKNLSSLLDNHQLISGCYIIPPGRASMKCQLDIKHLNYDTIYQKTYLGARIQVPEIYSKLIAKLVAHIQSEALSAKD